MELGMALINIALLQGILLYGLAIVLSLINKNKMNVLKYFFDEIDLSEFTEEDEDSENFVIKGKFVNFAKRNGFYIKDIAFDRVEAKCIAKQLAVKWFRPKANQEGN